MTLRDIIKSQIIISLYDAKFPIATPAALLNAFPHGAETTCQADNFKVTAGQAGKLLSEEDFPFLSAEHVAETIVTKAGL